MYGGCLIKHNIAVISSGTIAKRQPLARVKEKRDELRLVFLSDEPHQI